MRRLAVLLLALALPAVALAADTDPQKRFTAADNAKAASIVLKRADFATGWKRMPATPDSPDEFRCAGYDPDQSDLVLTGEAQADFTAAQGSPAVVSVANVFKTRAQATASWTRTVKAPLLRCLTQALQEAFAKQGTKATVTRKGAIAFPRYAPRTAAYRFSFDVSQGAGGRTIPFTIHLVGLGQGRGDAMLMTMGLGSGLPLAQVKSFARLTAQRLAAARL